MYAFFYSLYMSLFEGTWTEYTTAQAQTALTSAWNDLVNIVANALGGGFTSVQTISSNLQSTPQILWACALALATLTGVCLLVWKLTRGIFSIFFGGRR